MTSRTRSTYWRRALLVAVAIAVVTVAANHGGSSDQKAPTPTGSRPAASAPEVAAPVPATAAFDPFAAALDPSILSADALREALQQYQQQSVYPPSSHLFTEQNAAQMMREWNDSIDVDLSFDDRPGQETVVRFGADRQHVGFGEALTTWIEVWPAADPAVRLEIEVRSAVVLSTGGARHGRTNVALAYRDDGIDGDAVAGDHIYTNRFVPSSRDELAEALQVHISAEIEAGGVARLITRDFTYTPRPVLDLVAVDSAVVDGSLAVVLDLEVYEPGRYLMFCDVYAADGETPIGWITPPWMELASGSEQVSLSLFGKLLRDRGIDGPYVIKGIRAMRAQTEREAAAWWSDPREHRTRPFRLDDFSPAEWNDPERQEIIATLERSIEEQDAAERRAAGSAER